MLANEKKYAGNEEKYASNEKKYFKAGFFIC